MFGPALLINPVTEYKARTRTVYLPSGTSWYDLRSGRHFKGGQTIMADAPIHRHANFCERRVDYSLRPGYPVYDRKGLPTPFACLFTPAATAHLHCMRMRTSTIIMRRGSFQWSRWATTRKTMFWQSENGRAGSRECWRGEHLRLSGLTTESLPTLNSNRKPDASVMYDGNRQSITMGNQ